MTEHVEQELEAHEAFEASTDGYRVKTTVFEASVTVEEESGAENYIVTVEVPTLDSATTGEVGPTVATDWRETFERRLEDAPKATRAAVELDSVELTRSAETLTVEFRFQWETPATAVDIAKTFVEYVEGTYAEGLIPGYQYEGPAAELLSNASQNGEGGTPL